MAQAIQYALRIRNAVMQTIADEIGTSPILRVYTDSRPPAPASSSVGTLIAELALPSTWYDVPGDGTLIKLGTWSGTTIAGGVIGYYRIFDSGDTECLEQGSVTQAISLVTTSGTSAGSNVVNVADTTGIVAGVGVFGAGVALGATVLSVTSTTVTMSSASVGGISSGATVTFGDVSGNLQLNNVTFSPLQSIVIDAKTVTCPGA